MAVLRAEDDYVRFTAKWPRIVGTEATAGAQARLNDLLLDNSVQFLLTEGDLLIVDQRRVAHGRLTLGSEQNAVPAQERRLVMQSFGRRW